MIMVLKIILFIDTIILSGSVLFQKGEEAGLGSITGSAEDMFGDKRKGYYDTILMRTTIVTSIVMASLSVALLMLTVK